MSVDLSEISLYAWLRSTMQKLSFGNDLVSHKNGFTGELPEWFGEIRRLETSDFSGNNFSGQTPDAIGTLQSLKLLNVSKNGLAGVVHESMSNYLNLLVLDINHISLTEDLPSWVSKLGLLQFLLSANRLNGSIDSVLASSTKNSGRRLLILVVSQNKLPGEVSSAAGNFSGLQLLNISRNSLLRSISTSIERLKTLLGNIPKSIGNCSLLMT